MQFEVLDPLSGFPWDMGPTVVIVSHDLLLVTKYCNKIVLIHDHGVYAKGDWRTS